MSRWRAWKMKSAKVCGAALIAWGAQAAFAQQPAQQADIVRRGMPVNPETFDGKEPNEGVNPPESLTAMDKLAAAQRMERQKEWNKSADFYQEILSDPQFANSVVPSEQDANHFIYQYKSVVEVVMQRLSRWPQEGLDVYRARYETPAQTLLQSANGDPATLQEVYSRYFVTDSGKAAAIMLMDRDLESGEFRGAAAIGERLLNWHPNIAAERAEILYRVAVAYHLAGDDADARTRLNDLKAHDAQAKGTVRGKDVLLADSLADELAEPVPVAAGSSSDSYETFGGDATRNRILTANTTPGAHLYSIALSRPARVTGPQAAMLEARYKQDVKDGFTLGVVPVVDRGELFFQDGERVYGIDLESGVPLPGWLQSHGPDHDGAYTLPGVSGSPRDHQLTLTVTDHAVFAVMGQPDQNMARVGLTQDGNIRLVCLDRRTGKENWVVNPVDLKGPAILKNLQLCGSPLVIGDKVLLVANARKEGAFEEDCYVVAFDASSGALRWYTSIASANIYPAAWAGFNPNFPLPQNESHLSYANGRVFVQTNRGAVAAVDAYSGNIEWLDLYPRGQQQMANPAFNVFAGGQVQTTPIRPWVFNPVIVSQGMVFTLPMEGKNLLIYDAAGGQEFKRIDLMQIAQMAKGEAVQGDEYDTLVGVSGSKLILAGADSLIMLDWRKYDGAHFNNDMVDWIEGASRLEGTSGSSIRGRPLLTASSVFVAATDRLDHFALKSGLLTDAYPKYPQTWDETEGPGNLLVTSDHTIIAGADAVAVYTDLDKAKQKLDVEVASNPKDPQPRLRYAEVMFAAADYPTCLTKLDETIDLLGGANSMPPGPVRDRLLSDSLAFAQRLRAASEQATRNQVDKFFDHAKLAAYTPEQKVQYLMSRGRFEETRNEPPSALALYQQILLDPATRSVPLTDDNGLPASADLVARNQIAAMIARDPQIYDPFEKQAAAALEKAQGINNPDALQEVAQEFPNSTVAPQAMLAAADAYESGGDLRAARHVLTDIYFSGGAKSAQGAQLLEAMARTDPRTAAHMLAQGVEQFHDPKLAKPIVLPDKTEIAAGTAFSEALAKVRKISLDTQDRVLPNFHLPIPQDYPTYPKPFKPDGPVVDNIDALVSPVANFGRPDRLVAWSNGTGVSIFAATEPKPLTTAAFGEQALGYAWLDKDLLVWGASKMVLLQNEGAQAAWSMDATGLAPLQVIATDQNVAPPPEPNPNQVGLNGRMRVINGQVILNGQRMVIRNNVLVPVGAGGAAAVAKPVAAGPEQIDQVLPVADRILVSTTTGRVFAIDTKTGHVAWQTRLSDRPIDRLVANEDFTVIKSEDDATVRLAVLDTFTGHVRGSKSYARDSNSFPQNIALSPDGTLIFTLPDRICLKDLYQPWDHRLIERAMPPGQASFFNLTAPNQLLISEGKILALTDSGDGARPGEKFVRIFSLETGEPVLLKFGENQLDKAWSIGTKSTDVAMHVIGRRLFVIAPDAAVCYNLDAPDEYYQMFDQDTGEGMSAQISFIGKDYLVLLGGATVPVALAPPAAVAPNAAPNPPPPAPAAPEAPVVSPTYTIYAFSRAEKNGRESGRLDYSTNIANPAGITNAWQPMDGGLAYLSADRKLHMLIGAR